MTFYISPPRGNISLQHLTQYAWTRYIFLTKILDAAGDRIKQNDVIRETVAESECLIEGSAKDRVGHFTLRLLCCLNKDMTDFLVSAETLLFDLRFSAMNESELVQLLKSLDSFILKGKHLTCGLRSVWNSLNHLKTSCTSWKNLARKYLKGSDECFCVPFQSVLKLVARRQVNLDLGIASVPVQKLREVLNSIFKEMLVHSLKHAASKVHIQDERIRLLMRQLRYTHYKKYKDTEVYSDFETLSHTALDTVMFKFPPCMSHLHRQLRQNHRLRHHARIQLILFLKEAGLPVHEALMMWRKEYSIPPSSREGCTHDWSRDGQRYTYNIRHLYGLEGSSINYRGHSCVALQDNNPGHCGEGGCVFAVFDQAHLEMLMREEGVEDSAASILALSAEGHYSLACEEYRRARILQSFKSKDDPAWQNDDAFEVHDTETSTAKINKHTLLKELRKNGVG